MPSRQEGDDLLGGDLQFPSEAAADVRGDDANLGLGHAQGQGEHHAQDVRHLGGRPHRDLLASGVDDDGARLHKRGYESLLAVFALDQDFGVADGVFHVVAGAGFLGVEHPGGGAVGAEVGVGEHLVGGCLL